MTAEQQSAKERRPALMLVSGLCWDSPNQSPSTSIHSAPFLESSPSGLTVCLDGNQWIFFLSPPHPSNSFCLSHPPRVSSPLTALAGFTWSFYQRSRLGRFRWKLGHDHKLPRVATAVSQCSPAPVGIQSCAIRACKFFLLRFAQRFQSDFPLAKTKNRFMYPTGHCCGLVILLHLKHWLFVVLNFVLREVFKMWHCFVFFYLRP